MRKIKFRGRDYFTGEWHYGFYFEDEDGANILKGSHAYLVDPESVAQFVGCDAEGNAVYEGDNLVDAAQFSQECVAKLNAEAEYLIGGANGFDDENCKFILKERMKC